MCQALVSVQNVVSCCSVRLIAGCYISWLMVQSTQLIIQMRHVRCCSTFTPCHGIKNCWTSLIFQQVCCLTSRIHLVYLVIRRIMHSLAFKCQLLELPVINKLLCLATRPLKLETWRIRLEQGHSLWWIPVMISQRQRMACWRQLAMAWTVRWPTLWKGQSLLPVPPFNGFVMAWNLSRVPRRRLIWPRWLVNNTLNQFTLCRPLVA